MNPNSDGSAPNENSTAGRPLPDPYPEYLTCPHCGELEVEVWCYETRVRCHRCGGWIEHQPPPCRGQSAICRVAMEQEKTKPTDEKPDGG